MQTEKIYLSLVGDETTCKVIYEFHHRNGEERELDWFEWLDKRYSGLKNRWYTNPEDISDYGFAFDTEQEVLMFRLKCGS